MILKEILACPDFYQQHRAVQWLLGRPGGLELEAFLLALNMNSFIHFVSN